MIEGIGGHSTADAFSTHDPKIVNKGMLFFTSHLRHIIYNSEYVHFKSISIVIEV